MTRQQLETLPERISLLTDEVANILLSNDSNPGPEQTAATRVLYEFLLKAENAASVAAAYAFQLEDA